ncbi:retrovirus-related pol polyprotein from transposon TNT 1-94 [Tanacetum coccineum]
MRQTVSLSRTWIIFKKLIIKAGASSFDRKHFTHIWVCGVSSSCYAKARAEHNGSFKLELRETEQDLCRQNCPLDFGTSAAHKHMTRRRSQLPTSSANYWATVKFNKMIQLQKIRVMETIQIGNVLQFQGTDNGTEFVNQTLREYYEKVGISHETSVACSPRQNGVVERRNRTLIEAVRTMLIYAKAPLFLWAEAVATACYTQIVHVRFLSHGKTPYELLHNKPPDISYLHVFGALCYPTNDSENLGKLQPKADIDIFIGYAPTKKAFQIYNKRTRQIVETIHVDFDELTAMASEHNSSGPALHEMTLATISSGLVPNPHPSTPFVPPSRTDWDILFQPLFDEFLNPSPSVDHPTPEVVVPINEVIAPVLADSTGSPSSTTVDQDAPSLSNSQTTPETEPPVIPNDVEEDNHDIEVAHMGNDPYFGVPIPEIPSDQSSSSDSIHTIVHPDHQISEHNSKWTKDHPLENIIGELARPVSTRLQLHEQALFCYYDAFLTAVEPKTYKDALTQAYQSYGDFTLTKWIYKSEKLDELGGILKNKARLVARGYRQEEGIDFEESFAPVARLELKIPEAIFINQSKYALESLKKYGFDSCDPVDTPMVEKSKLDEDKEGKAVDPSHYRGSAPIRNLINAVKGSFDVDHAGCQVAQKRLRYPVGKAEYIAYCPDVLCSNPLDEITAYPTMALDSIKFQCTVITKALLPYAVTTFNIPVKHIDIRFPLLSRSMLRNGCDRTLLWSITKYQLADISLKLWQKKIEFLINKWGCGFTLRDSETWKIKLMNSSLLDAACKKVQNLLKKGLLKQKDFRHLWKKVEAIHKDVIGRERSELTTFERKEVWELRKSLVIGRVRIRDDKRRKREINGNNATQMELTLEQTH